MGSEEQGVRKQEHNHESSELVGTMPSKRIQDLHYLQGGDCFFCEQPLRLEEASVEHLVAKSNKGSDHTDNCVLCCKTLNALMGSISLKEKFKFVMNQKGDFKCPARLVAKSKAAAQISKPRKNAIETVIADLKRRKSARPGTVKTLRNTIVALLANGTTDKESEFVVEQLKVRGIIEVDGNKVSYLFPESKK